MDTVDVTPNQKGSIGETLVLHGRTVPHPVEEAIETLVEEEYEVVENTPIRISNEYATYLNLSRGDGDYSSTRTDGAFLRSGSLHTVKMRLADHPRATVRISGS